MARLRTMTLNTASFVPAAKCARAQQDACRKTTSGGPTQPFTVPSKTSRILKTSGAEAT